MDLIAFMNEYGVGAPTGTLVKAERLSLSPDNERNGSLRLEFSCGRVIHMSVFGSFRVDHELPAPEGPARFAEWLPELPSW